MGEIAVVGDSEFAMGFQLIGIKKVFLGSTSHDIKSCFEEAMSPDIGLVVTNDRAVSKLDPISRKRVESSVSPIILILSKESMAQENLRDMIKKAIGIDLMNR